MKHTYLFSFMLGLALFAIAGCGQAPLTEAEQAEQYGMTIDEYQEVKDAAARMNMTVEEHMNMGH
jgi:predicted small lipoprotein YifL